jgi:hypothetical protein
LQKDGFISDRHAQYDPLTAFYRDDAQDDAGRTWEQIVSWSDDRLEAVHDFIQWLFPLPEPSGANPWAPTLSPASIQAFHASPEMRERLRGSFLRMLRFYGLQWTDGKRVERADGFARSAENWLWPGNHNHLRLTRILRSLRLLGLEEESASLFAALQAIQQEFPSRITPRTFSFWREAAPPIK